MLQDSNPHLLSAKTLDYPLGYRRMVIKVVPMETITQSFYKSKSYRYFLP